MSTHLLGRVALATMPALIMLTAMTPSPAAAVMNIDGCQTLDKFGATYRVTQDLSSCDTACLVVANDRITIDLQGHEITSDCPNIGPPLHGSVEGCQLAQSRSKATYECCARFWPVMPRLT